jgi:hypothetical protein
MLERVAREAQRAQLPVPRFEAQLALAQIELASGTTQAAAGRLIRVEREAAALGLQLMARKAASLRQRPG